MARACTLAIVLAAWCPSVTFAQASTRRLTTIEAIRQFPGFYHLQNVLLHGEFVESANGYALRANDREMRVLLESDVRAISGPAEVRAQVIDVGRLEAGDPRAGRSADTRSTEQWPRPGEEMLLRVTAVSGAEGSTQPSVRLLALEPWRFAGERVTIVGNFRGRNLFGDLPGAPGRNRYEYVLRGAEGAVWITGMRPRGRDFDLDLNRRADTDRWLEVTGTVVHERGLVRVEATAQTLTKAPPAPATQEEPAGPVVPAAPVQVVFSSPTEGEIDISPTGSVRIQFSRGLDPKSLSGGVRVGYVGATGPTTAAPQYQTAYDAGNRALEITFTQPLERFRTIRVEVLDTLKGFDGAPVTPWALTYSVTG